MKFTATALGMAIFLHLNLAFARSAPSLKGDALAEKSDYRVIIFVSPICPCSAQNAKHLGQLQRQFPQFSFTAINGHRDMAPNEAARVFTEQGLDLPIVFDPDLKYANWLGAVKTPQVFVLDPKGEIMYEGGVANSMNPEKAKNLYLQEALVALAEKKIPSVRETRTLGCYISR